MRNVTKMGSRSLILLHLGRRATLQRWASQWPTRSLCHAPHNKCPLLPTSSQPSTEPSFTLIQQHDKAPYSYGVETFNGYLEMIPAQTALPFSHTELLEGCFDDIKPAPWSIHCRRSILEAPVEIARSNIEDPRLFEGRETLIQIKMALNTDLKGRLTLQNMRTRRSKHIEFCGLHPP